MGVIIADLPTTEDITSDSYVIIEKPGVGEGTYKGTVGDLKRDINAELQGLKDSIDTLNDTISNLTSQLYNMNSRIDSVETKLEKLTETMMWKGTEAEWEALTPTEKLQYKIVNIIDA